MPSKKPTRIQTLQVFPLKENLTLTPAQVKTKMDVIRSNGIAAAQQSALISNLIEQMNEEFGFCTSQDLFGSGGPQKAVSAAVSNKAMTMRTNGDLLGFSRRGKYLHPNFQFATDDTIYPGLKSLLLEAQRCGVSHLDLSLWLCTSSPALDGRRPVDSLGDDRSLWSAFTTDFYILL